MKNHDFSTNKIPPSGLDHVESQVNSLRFGVVQIIIHESRVVQIEKTENLRVDNPKPSPLDHQRP